MPILIDGYITVSTKKLADHEHHPIYFRNEARSSLWCDRCLVMLEQEPEPSTRLYCGCTDQAEHDEGARLQADYRRRYRVSKHICIGCYTGDDAASLHSCAVHS